MAARFHVTVGLVNRDDGGPRHEVLHMPAPAARLGASTALTATTGTDLSTSAAATLATTTATDAVTSGAATSSSGAVESPSGDASSVSDTPVALSARARKRRNRKARRSAAAGAASSSGAASAEDEAGAGAGAGEGESAAAPNSGGRGERSRSSSGGGDDAESADSAGEAAVAAPPGTGNSTNAAAGGDGSGAGAAAPAAAVSAVLRASRSSDSLSRLAALDTELTAGADAADETIGAGGVAASLLGPGDGIGGASGDGSAAADAEGEVYFSSGVVHVTYGTLHLFRDTSRRMILGGGAATAAAATAAAATAAAATAGAAAAAAAATAALSGDGSGEHAEPDRGATLCVVAVPLRMTPSEFCTFTANVASTIKHMRILRQPRSVGVYAVLITFVDQASADTFFADYNGRRFNSLEHESARIVYVADVQFAEAGGGGAVANGDVACGDADAAGSADGDGDGDGGGGGQADNAPAASSSSPASASRQPRHPHGEAVPHAEGHTEIPTCPVCLERLDSSATGVLTTVCNHSFHCDCLRHWEDSSCPVCRYTQMDEAPPTTCSVCGEEDKLWMCLICGHVGCGRYSNEHAKAHFEATAHTYALELETQRVWDYAGDGYVHRLIQNKTDGKLVELPDPFATSAERSQVPPLTDTTEATIVRQKLDNMHAEYNSLLASQLEAQRDYFERRLAEAEAAVQERDVLAARLTTMERQRRGSERRAAEAARKEAEVTDEVKLLRTLNATLLSNQDEWRAKLEDAEKQRKDEADAAASRVADLEEQVRDLMVFLDAQKRVADHPDGDTLRDAAVVGVSEAPTPATGAGAGRRGKGRRRG